MSYWTSGQAQKTFGLEHVMEDSEDGDLLVTEVVRRRIEQMKAGFATANGWKGVLDDFDSTDLYSGNDIFQTQVRCRYVSIALRISFCLLYTSPSPRDLSTSRMPSSA